jgi:hypothetical protein
MSNKCVESGTFQAERQEYIKKVYYTISQIVDVAKTTTDINGITWDEANNRNREDMLLRAEYNGQTINTVLNELVNNNYTSEKEITDFNNLIKKQIAEINKNNTIIQRYDNKIQNIKNTELLAEGQLDDSEEKYKALKNKYYTFLIILIVVILLQIAYVYFYLRMN